LGDAEPALDAATHNECGAPVAGRSPVFFRARLALASEQSTVDQLIDWWMEQKQHSGFPAMAKYS